MPKSNTAVAERKTTEIAIAELDAFFDDHVGEGMEGAGQEAFAIPFLNILQTNSPQCSRANAAYVEGAEEGLFFDTVSQKVLGEKLVVIPCYWRQAFVEFKLRTEGGGFVQEHAPGEQPRTTLNEDHRDVCDNGHELLDTRYHYVLVVDPELDTFKPYVITMTRTQIKKSKAWMTKMDEFKKEVNGQLRRLPTYSQLYELGVKSEQNDQYSWWNFQIEHAGQVQSLSLARASAEFHKSIGAGTVKVATPEQSDAGGEQPAY